MKGYTCTGKHNLKREQFSIKHIYKDKWKEYIEIKIDFNVKGYELKVKSLFFIKLDNNLVQEKNNSTLLGRHKLTIKNFQT